MNPTCTYRYQGPSTGLQEHTDEVARKIGSRTSHRSSKSFFNDKNQQMDLLSSTIV